jgi:hypothetical protein
MTAAGSAVERAAHPWTPWAAPTNGGGAGAESARRRGFAFLYAKTHPSSLSDLVEQHHFCEDGRRRGL